MQIYLHFYEYYIGILTIVFILMNILNALQIMSACATIDGKTKKEAIHMSIEKARAFFRAQGIENRVREFSVSSATVELAAQALGVDGARIAKSLSFKMGEGCVIVVAAGDARVDNRKFKDTFHIKPTMLPHDDVERLIGHAVGGVCPFGRNEGVPVYIDESVKRFKTMFPAVGSDNSAIELSVDELYKYSDAIGWVDVCKLPEESAK